MRYVVDHDLHLHSKISLCSGDEGQTVERILQFAFQKCFVIEHFRCDGDGTNREISADRDGYSAVGSGRGELHFGEFFLELGCLCLKFFGMRHDFHQISESCHYLPPWALAIRRLALHATKEPDNMTDE